MRIPHVVLHLGQIRSVIQILQFRHVRLCIAVVLVSVHGAV